MLELADLDRARKRLEGAIYESPCPYSQTLSELSGARCFVKLENLQMTGSFKDRGAANLLLQLNPAERARGVVAASAGNHGLAVAFHASRLGTPAVIVMPEWAPLIKVTSSRRYGAEVILHGANYDEAYGRAREVQAERGLTFVHPFDDERVIAGQGTLGLELLAQRPDMDAVLVPVGGGGLVGGAGAAPLAALLNRTLGLAGLNVVLVLSGGNIDVTVIARIIERGLVKDGRLVRLGVLLRDRPGALARLTALIAAERANIMNIEHDRAFSSGAIGETRVGLTLETSGRAQIDALKERLEAAGYRVEERTA